MPVAQDYFLCQLLRIIVYACCSGLFFMPVAQDYCVCLLLRDIFMPVAQGYFYAQRLVC